MTTAAKVSWVLGLYYFPSSQLLRLLHDLPFGDFVMSRNLESTLTAAFPRFFCRLCWVSVVALIPGGISSVSYNLKTAGNIEMPSGESLQVLFYCLKYSRVTFTLSSCPVSTL